MLPLDNLLCFASSFAVSFGLLPVNCKLSCGNDIFPFSLHWLVVHHHVNGDYCIEQYQAGSGKTID